MLLVAWQYFHYGLLLIHAYVIYAHSIRVVLLTLTYMYYLLLINQNCLTNLLCRMYLYFLFRISQLCVVTFSLQMYFCYHPLQLDNTFLQWSLVFVLFYLNPSLSHSSRDTTLLPISQLKWCTSINSLTTQVLQL